MKIIDFDQFMMTTWQDGWPPRESLAALEGKKYRCICGEKHPFALSSAARELEESHFVVECPNDKGLVCVQAKGLVFVRLLPKYGAFAPEKT